MNEHSSDTEETRLILVHGLFAQGDTDLSSGNDSARGLRARAIAEHGEALGVRDYEWIDGSGKGMANRLLAMVRGTARAVDAVEIIELDGATARASLADESGQSHWRQALSCAPCGLDTERSFILMGAPRQLLTGSPSGQRILWFGNGLSHLDAAGFIAHYTGRHGPLVAGHAAVIGLQRYRQVPDEQSTLCNGLRQLGLGRAASPGVFAELVMGRPPMNLASIRQRRAASKEIKADEKRHIDFGRSMLLLV